MDIHNIEQNKELFNRVFRDTIFHKIFLYWVNKDQVLTSWNMEYLIANFLHKYSDQETIDDFYYTMYNHLIHNEDNKESNKFFLNVKKEVGKLLYKQLEPYACVKNSTEYELIFELKDIKFFISFLDSKISTVDHKFYTYYDSRFKAIQNMFNKDTTITVIKDKDSIFLDIDYNINLKESFILYKDDIYCPFCNKNHKDQNRFCDNDCGTVYCYCGNEYHIINDIPVGRHSPKCVEDSDVDSVEEYRKSTELHTKVREDFYVRKRIFRHEFNSDNIITKMSLPEDVKERIFAKFDDLSDRFKDKYGGVKSFLPYQYIFSRLLLEEGYEYPYTCTDSKYKAMEELYWSVKDAKDYSNFINFLKSPTQSEDFEIYKSPKKVVIQRSLSRGNTTVYLLTVKGDFDLALQYFTKVLPKLGKNPEYRYNIFILDMKEKLKLETISLNDVINYMVSYVINELMYFAEEL